MRVEPLNRERSADFVRYCLKHRNEVDESFLYDEDLNSFRPDEENPTYILLDAQGELVGVASLIIDEYLLLDGGSSKNSTTGLGKW